MAYDMFGPFAIERALEEVNCSGFPWYVYTLIRLDNGEPFYVGKGSGSRLIDHARLDKVDHNYHKKAIVKKCGGYLVSIEGYAFFEVDAYEMEKQLIYNLTLAGYKLTNQSKGGEGNTGYVFTDEDRKKISKGVKKYLNDNPDRIAELKIQSQELAKLPRIREIRRENMKRLRSRRKASKLQTNH